MPQQASNKEKYAVTEFEDILSLQNEMDSHIKSFHASNATLKAENAMLKQKNKELRTQRKDDEWLLHSYQLERVEWQCRLRALEDKQYSAAATCDVLSGKLLCRALPWFVSHGICAGQCAVIRTKQSKENAQITTLANQFRDLVAKMEDRESKLANAQNDCDALSSEPL